jgi:hypothetical protein
MATRTSTQSGNFNSTATWGGNPVPVDGDDFIVNYGHIVTINDDRRVTNGYNDSYVRGKLYMTGSGKLRMNGILYVDNTAGYTTWFTEGVNSAGFFRMDPGALLEIKGTNSEQHRLQIQNQQYVTCEIEGTNPNPQTTLSVSAEINDTSLVVDDASQFAAGGWITIYRNDYVNKDQNYIKSDESVWIQDVDSLNDVIYFRKFVSPETIIINASNSTITVDNAKVLRVGYKIIFGSGDNRNIKTITAIDFDKNILTVNSSITGSVVNEKIYRTGLDKAHISTDIVLRLAAVLTQDSNQGTNTIVVNNTNGFSVGDLIMVPVNDPNYSNATSWDNIMDYTISSIDTNTKTITLTGGFSSPATTTLQRNAKVGVGGIVVNLTRDTKIKAPEGTTYGTDQTSFVHSANLPGNYTRRIRLSNCLINVGANSVSAEYGCIGLRGSFSYQNTTASGVGTSYTSYFDGIVIYPTRRISRNCGYWWDHHYLNTRNCISYNSGSWPFARYGNNHGFFGNIAARCADNIYFEGMYDTSTQIAYNFCTRFANNVLQFSQWYEPTSIVRQNILVFSTGYPIYAIYLFGTPVIQDCYINYFLLWPYMERGSQLIFNNCYLGNSWDVTNWNGTGVYSDSINVPDVATGRMERKSAQSSNLMCHGYNFEYGKSVAWNRRALRLYDNNEGAWRVYPDRDQGGWMGFTNDIYIPANSQVFIRASVKTASGNTNYPYIFARNYIDGSYSGRFFNLSESVLDFNSPLVSPGVGFLDTSVRFTASSNTWENRTLTLPAIPFDYYLVIGIGCSESASNSRLGWWEKDLDIAIENSNGLVENVQYINSLSTRLPVRVKSSMNQLKTILGG